jgi:hypothetical protein
MAELTLPCLTFSYLAVMKIDFEKIVTPVFQNTLAVVTTLAGHLKMTIVQILDQFQGVYSFPMSLFSFFRSKIQRDLGE